MEITRSLKRLVMVWRSMGKLPLEPWSFTLYVGEVLRARSQFRIIMNEFCEIAYSEGSKVDQYLAHHFRKRLEEWYNNLPESLTPKRIVLPGQLPLQ